MAASNARKTTNTNGVSQQENNAQTETPKTGRAKAPLTGKKVVIRRLPPGMTAEEAWNVLGEEWKNGHGKVDWSQFQTGSISHELVPLSSRHRRIAVIATMSVAFASLQLH